MAASSASTPIDELQSASVDVVDHAADITATLPDLASCADVDAIASGPGAPPPAIAANVGKLETELVHVKARQVAGRTDTLDTARAMLAGATKLRDSLNRNCGSTKSGRES